MTSTDQWSDIQKWIERSSTLLIKKLSQNDCSWAVDSRKHQSGVYIPADIRKSGFFPPLQAENPKKPHIYVAEFGTLWPATGETKQSRIRHFSNKGSEMHFTRVPKDQFFDLTPASLLIGGVLRRKEGEVSYWFMTVDSASEVAELLESQFDLGADFHFGMFQPSDVLKLEKDETERLIDELEGSLKSGMLESFIKKVSCMPTPESLALDAQREYMRQHQLEDLDPYKLAKPGDAIMKISRDIEYSLYKRAETRHRAAEAIRIVTDGGGSLVTSIVRNFPKLDAMFLSASQQRKSRAGRSFEQHIARLLKDGRVSFEEQAVTGGRRPDFVLPNLRVLKSKARSFDEALVLSAKTTLRERWKQVALEKFRCGLFLATVDDRISSEAIDDMNTLGIHLVVPESLKTASAGEGKKKSRKKRKANGETCYGDKSNVITFREFFDEEISVKRAGFRSVLTLGPLS